MAYIESRPGPRGRRVWRAQIRRSGYPPQSGTFDTKAAAETWARQIESAMDRGEWADRAEGDCTTLHAALARYENEIIPDKAISSQRTARNRLRRLQRHPFAMNALTHLSGADLAEYIKTRRDEKIGASANDIRLDLALISHVYTVAQQDWGMPYLSNPVKAVRKPRPPRGRERRLKNGEEARVIDAARAYGGEIGLIITWAIETAMRRSEIMAMRWSHIDRVSRVLLVPESKNGEARKVPFSTRALAVLDELVRHIDGRVWSGDVDYVTRAFTRVAASARMAYEQECKQARQKPDEALLRDLRFHDLRHEATSRLFERGLNPMEVSAITGHKTLQMLKRYTHLRAEDLVGRLG